MQLKTGLAFLLICLASIRAQTENIRDVRSLEALGSHMPNAMSFISEAMGNFKQIMSAMKMQIKDLMMDMAFEFLKKMKSKFDQCKVRVLRRIGSYTIKDVIRASFESVSVFLAESDVERDAVNEDENRADLEYQPSFVEYNPSFEYKNPYTLEQLIQAGDYRK